VHGERVVGRQRGNERLDADGLDDEVRVIDRRAQQRDVQRPLEEPLDLGRREHLPSQVQPDPRQLGAQRLGEMGQERVGHRAREADRQATELARCRRPGVLLRGARRGEDRVRAVEQHLPRGQQLDAARRAPQQRRPDVGLEAADELRERRLGHVQPGGRATEVQLLPDGDERVQLTDLHVTEIMPFRV
jgi:hypothetical protein